MVLPFASIFVKTLFCSVADRRSAHRKFFLAFLFLALLGYGSFGILPFFLDPIKEQDGLVVWRWIVICIMTSIATLAMAVLTCLSDAFAVNSARAHSGTSFGYIRVWGTIGWAMSSFLVAFINQSEFFPYLVPGLLWTICAITIDILLHATWSNKDDYKLKESASGQTTDDIIKKINAIEDSEMNTPFPIEHSNQNQTANYGTTDASTSQAFQEEPSSRKISKLHLQWLLFKFVAARRPSLFRYLTLFTVAGALATLQWSYFFIYLEKIFEGSTQEFSFFSGLSMIGQSLLGELPFFILAKPLINCIGRSNALSLSIAAVGVRYFLYYVLPTLGGYFVLMTEMFQGPSFGLFYVVLTSVGLDYSDFDEAILDVVSKNLASNNFEEIDRLRHCLRSFMMSLASASYEGLGAGLGSVIGGFVIELYGFEKLWFWSSVIAIVLGLSTIDMHFFTTISRQRTERT